MKDIKDLSVAGILTTIFLFLLPFVSTENLFYGSVNAKYFYIICFTFILGLYYSYSLFTSKIKLSLSKSWLPILMVIVLATQYISAFLGVDTVRSFWSDISRSTGLFFVTSIFLLIFFLKNLMKAEDWSLARKSIAISAGIFSLITFFIDVNSGFTFGNTTFAGSYLLLAFVITLIEFFRAQSGTKIKKILGFLALLQFVSPILTNFLAIASGPAAILGSARASGATAILIAGYLIIRELINKFGGSYKTKTKLLFNVIVISGLLASIGMLFTPGTFIQDKYIESSTPARLFVWESGMKSFKERPWLGWGPENFHSASEKYFDSRLALQENIGEIWFDRAHNIMVDTLVSVGVVGVTGILMLLGYFIFVVKKAQREKIIGRDEALLLIVLVGAHFLQMQTSFDTPTTYLLIGFILAYGWWLESKLNCNKNINDFSETVSKTLSVAMILILVVGFKYLVVDELSRQSALYKIFTTSNRNEQLVLIDKAFGGKVDLESLRLASSSLIEGSLSRLASLDQAKAEILVSATLEQLSAYEKYYIKYLESNPGDYRIRMNYAYLLFTKTVLGEERLDEAKEIIANSYELSIDNPVTYAMDALASMYSGDFISANGKIDKAIEINPQIDLTIAVFTHIKLQEKTFPNIQVLNLKNL